VVRNETDADDGKTPPNKVPDSKPSVGGIEAPSKSTVVGTGWTAVFVARMDQPAPGSANTPEERAAADAASSFLQSLPSASGGKVISTKLVNVLITDDGRVLVGAVTQDRLAQVAADPAAALK
jgi:hypothetical protein